MIYKQKTEKKTFLVKEIFTIFTQEIQYGNPAEFADILYAKYLVESPELEDLANFEQVCGYFKKDLIPHKIAVFKAGMGMAEANWFSNLNISKVQFVENLYLHDLSKFSANESLIYAKHNFKNPSFEDKEAFKYAWHHHKMNNLHHAEYWLNPNKSGELQILDIPLIYVVEMIADWFGASYSYGTPLEIRLAEHLFLFKWHPSTALKVKEILAYLNIEVRLENGVLHL